MTREPKEYPLGPTPGSKEGLYCGNVLCPKLNLTCRGTQWSCLKAWSRDRPTAAAPEFWGSTGQHSAMPQAPQSSYLAISIWRHEALTCSYPAPPPPASALRGPLKVRGQSWVKVRSHFRGENRLDTSRALFTVNRQAKAFCCYSRLCLCS